MRKEGDLGRTNVEEGGCMSCSQSAENRGKTRKTRYSLLLPAYRNLRCGVSTAALPSPLRFKSLFGLIGEYVLYSHQVTELKFLISTLAAQHSSV